MFHCRLATGFNSPATSFSRHGTATHDRLFSHATPSMHINKWSFSHKSHFLRHSTNKIEYLMHLVAEFFAKGE